MEKSNCKECKEIGKDFQVKKAQKSCDDAYGVHKKAASVYPDRKFNIYVEENKSLLMKKHLREKRN